MTINPRLYVLCVSQVTRKAQLSLLLLSLLLLLMQGCQPRPAMEQQFVTYAERMSNVLEVPPPDFVFISYADAVLLDSFANSDVDLHRMSLPKIISSPPAASQTLSLREFQQLPACHELKPIVAQRNSSLGRVQSPSQHYLYQVTVVNLLKICAEKAAQAGASTSQLDQLLEHKFNDLTLHRHWFLRTEPAIRQSLQASLVLLRPNWNQHQETVSAWQSLAASPGELSAFPTSINNVERQLNTALQQLESNPFVNQLYNTLNWYTFQLVQLNQWLTVHLNQEQCASATSQKRVEYLSNILKLFFIGEIQEKSTKLSDMHYRLHPILKKIYNDSTIGNEFGELLAEQQSIFERYQHALKSHTLVWGDLLNRCNKRITPTT